MKINPQARIPLRSEQGSVLLISIILILALIIVTLGMFNLGSTQTKIATNSADSQIAFQTAEGALAQAEANILAGNFTTSSFAAGQAGLYIFNPANAPLWTTVDWSSSGAVMSSFTGNSRTASAVIIEFLPPYIVPGQSQNSQRQTFAYRITARAVGASGGSPVVLQSTVQVQQ